MLKYAGTLIVLVIAVVLVAGPGLPVQPTHATSNSMAPAIEQGDIYFVLESDDIEAGDIAMFYSSQRGDYTTHRVVESTEAGFITKGDNNPSADQEAGYPPVKDSAVVGKVIEFGGEPITIGGARPLISFIQANPMAFIGLAAVLLLGPELLAIRTGAVRPERDVIFARDLILPLFALGAFIGFVLILWGASTHSLSWVALGEVTGADHTIPTGEATTATVLVETYTPPLTTVIVEADGVTVLDQTVRGSTIELDVRVPAVESAGPYWTEVHVYPYPATLPAPLLEWLHSIHWFIAAAGSMVPVFGVAGLLYGVTLDGRMRLRLPRSRWLHKLGRKD